jgi:hypothetical protein
MRFPDSMDEECSTTGAVNLLQDCTRTGVDQQPGQALAEFAGLVGWAESALADVAAAVGRADDGVHSEFAAFKACPSTERNLAATLQCAEKRALGHDRLASFVVIEGSQGIRNFGIL